MGILVFISIIYDTDLLKLEQLMVFSQKVVIFPNGYEMIKKLDLKILKKIDPPKTINNINLSTTEANEFLYEIYLDTKEVFTMESG